MRKKLYFNVAVFVLFVLAVISFGAVSSAFGQEGQDEIYLDYGSGWHYAYGYIENFEKAGSNEFSLDGFSEGNAPFGFSDYEGVYDFTNGTIISGNESYYVFTTDFNVENPSVAVRLSIYYDDAVAIYINGNEVYRDNVTGYNFEKVISGDTVIATVGRAKETIFCFASELLKTGTNTVTAILVEDYKAGCDAYFDLKIEGIDKFEVSADGIPDTVSLTYYDNAFTSRGVTFYTSDELLIADARIRKSGESDYTYVRSVGEKWYGRVCHKVIFDDLEEGSEYEYALGLNDFDFWGKTFTFKTENSSDSDEFFKFGFLTDTQSSNAWEFSIWDGLMTKIEEYSEDFDFIVHGGDVVESSVSATTLKPEQWRDGFNTLQRYLVSTPTVPVVGNHEYSAYAFYKHFNIKYQEFDDSGAYYSFDYGNAHFTVLNTNVLYFDQYRTEQRMTAQYEWLENDLQKTDKTWKIVCMHFSAVSSATHEYDRLVRENLMPIFAKYDVDLVLQGHTHIYFRSALYAHSDDIKGENRTETFENLRNSVIAEQDVKTYVDATDGTFWTINPQGVEYVTLKSTNYNVYYQNLTYDTPDEECVFATNPINGEIMNGGVEGGADVGYLMNYYQYASIEVKQDSLKCNVYIIDTRTGERELFDQYCVIKTDSEDFADMVNGIPDVENLTLDDFETLLRVYGLYSALGGEYLTAEQIAKVERCLNYLNSDSIKRIRRFISDLNVLGDNDLTEFLRLNELYKSFTQNEKKFVDIRKLEEVSDSFEIKEVIAKINALSVIETLKLSAQEVENVVAMYDGLSDRQKTGITNYSLINELFCKLKAKTVMEKIDGLKVAPDKAQVDAVYEEYMQLSAEEKIYVENTAVLNSAKQLTSPQEGGETESCGSFIGGGAETLIAIVASALFIFVFKRKRV